MYVFFLLLFFILVVSFFLSPNKGLRNGQKLREMLLESSQEIK